MVEARIIGRMGEIMTASKHRTLSLQLDGSNLFVGFIRLIILLIFMIICRDTLITKQHHHEDGNNEHQEKRKVRGGAFVV